MPLDTRSFDLSRWWASAALKGVQSNPDLLKTSGAGMHKARRQLIAGTDMVIAIKNWLVAANLVQPDKSGYVLDKLGKIFLANDPEFEKSTSWWAIHLLLCFSKDSQPYNLLFSSLDPVLPTAIGQEALLAKVLDKFAGAAASLDTYMSGIFKMFRRDGAMEGLGLLERRLGGRKSGEETVYWRLGTPSVPDRVILFGIALARERHFSTRTSISFSELLTVNLDHFLTLPQDELRARIRKLAEQKMGITYTTNADLDSISFDGLFTTDRVLIGLLQEGGDTWM